jgi:hypothetical protein
VNLAFISGATSGLGKALACQLAGRGVPLFLTGRNKEKLEALAKKLQQDVPVFYHPADLSNPSERKTLISELHNRVPDLIINNAGFGLYGNALSYRTKEQLDILEVNSAALLEISLEAARALSEHKKGGTIVNVSSAAAFFTYPTLAVYAASKRFVKDFSEALDEELKPHGIRVLTACPGQIRTAFRSRAAKNSPQTPSAPFSMSVEKAAACILWQIEKGKTLYIFDWRYRIATFLARFILPKKTLLSLLKKGISDRS